jgi:hypothetical protein
MAEAAVATHTAGAPNATIAAGPVETITHSCTAGAPLATRATDATFAAVGTGYSRRDAVCTDRARATRMPVTADATGTAIA